MLPSGEDRKTALFLLNSLQVGGSEKKIVAIVNELSRRGYAVALAYLNEPETLRELVSDKVPMVCLGRKGKFSLSACRRLREFARKHRVGYVFSVNLYPLLYSAGLRYQCLNADTEYVSLLNTTEFVSLKAELGMLIYGQLLKRADKIVFGCQYQEKLWRDRYGLNPGKCLSIYNGVDTHCYKPQADRFDASKAKARYGFSPTQFVVGTVGQLRPEKQHLDLIRAIRRLREQDVAVQGLIVGDGPDRGRIEGYLDKHRMKDCVQLPGAERDVRQALAAMDVFALTSIAVETFSNATLEAMAMEKAVVSSDLSGMPELIRAGENGLLYPKGQVTSLADHLQLLRENPDFRRQLELNARETVLSRFTFPAMVDQYEGLISPKVSSHNSGTESLQPAHH